MSKYRPAEPEVKPQKIKTVSFVHEELWHAFLGWLASRGLHAFEYPDNMQSDRKWQVQHGIGVVVSGDTP